MTTPEDIRVDAAKKQEQAFNTQRRVPADNRNGNLYRDPEVYMVWNYNRGSPFHTSTGEPVGLSEATPEGPNRIVGPRIFSMDFSGSNFPDAQKHTHNIISSYIGLWKPGTTSDYKPQDFIVNGALDYGAILERARASAEDVVRRFPQDVIDKEVSYVSIDQEFLSYIAYLYGFTYQTQSRDYATDLEGMDTNLYDQFMVAYLWGFINRIKQLAPHVTLDFYALPQNNYLVTSSWDVPRGLGAENEIPDAQVRQLVNGFLSNPHITRILFQNYVNTDPTVFNEGKWKTRFPQYTLANLTSNLEKYYLPYPQLWSKAPAAMYWLPFWDWDIDYEDSMSVFGECMAATYQSGINHVYLSGGTWDGDGTPTDLINKIESAGRTIEQFWSDLKDQIQSNLLKRLVFRGGVPSPANNLIT